MPSPILARADALMHRKRQTEADIDDVPVLTDAIDDEDDIPVLIDEAPSALEQSPPMLPPSQVNPEFVVAEAIEFDEAVAEPSSVTPPDQEAACTAIPSDLALREQLASELARRVEQRLVAELPRIIESTLRDFLAEQAMITAASPRD